MKKTILIAFVVVLVLAGGVWAGNNPIVKVAVHVKAHNSEQSCGDLPAIATCEDIITTFAGSSFDAFPVFFDLTEYKGVKFGLCWPDWIYSAAWSGCADMETGDIVWPGDGVYLTWTGCQAGAVLIPGWAWIYADGPGQVSVCNHPEAGAVEVFAGPV